MKKGFIEKALNGKLEWFDPSKQLTEEEFRKSIKESINRHNDKDIFTAIEELSELTKAVTKMERGCGDRLNLHEEVCDVIWAIGFIIEKYNLDEETIKQIRRLKMEKNRMDGSV